jgi:pimeloyl-ACP methyl ester carboxylesterase
VGTKDQTVHPDLERAMAKRMKASVHEVESSHVPMLSQPKFVLDVIRAAAKSAGKS